jgi:succinate dehydrogenase / fumarate reductase cytochrome b subunit
MEDAPTELRDFPQGRKLQRVRSKNPISAWFDVRRDRAGSWAFALNRLTALGLTFYLFLHLAVLFLLTRGEEGWNSFLEVAKTPFFLTLDVVLIFGVLFHGLNGIRLTLVGLGLGADRQRSLFWIVTAITVVLLAISAYLVFTL